MIDDLSTYELVHFLPFTQEVYDRMFLLHNDVWWPVHLVALLVAAVVLAATIRERSRVVGAALAVAWMFVGVAFFGFRYAELLWVAPWIGAAFGAQAALLVFATRGRLIVERPRLGAAAFGAIVVGWMLLTPVFGRPWGAVEVFGMTPDPTALATLGLLCGTSRRTWFLWPIPVVWCAVSLATWTALSG